jgi:hypothetical protein
LKQEEFETKREPINVCPGLGFKYKFPAEEAKKLDSKNSLTEAVKNRMKEGLGIVDREIAFI